MNVVETINIDIYPWAVPTDAQRAWFDSLPLEKKREAILAAIEEGFSAPLSIKSMDDVIEEARAEIADA